MSDPYTEPFSDSHSLIKTKCQAKPTVSFQKKYIKLTEISLTFSVKDSQITMNSSIFT